MLADDLLLWLSAQGKGSWYQFRNAVHRLQDKAEELEDNEETSLETQEFDTAVKLPIYRLLQLNLSMLGHVEFYYEDNRYLWRIAPPFLVVTKLKGVIRGVLCGARWPGFIEDITKSAAYFTDISIERCLLNNAPEALFLNFRDLEGLSKFAERSHIGVLKHASMALLSSIPSLIYPSLLKAKPLPYGLGWSVEHFDTGKLKWIRVSTNGKDWPQHGLKRFSAQYAPNRYFLIRRTSRKRNIISCEVSPRAGKYLVLKSKDRSVIKYEPETESFILPAICRPPILIERALVLCSGLLPSLDRSQYNLTYSGVPLEVAKTVSKLLEQELL